MNLQVRPNLSSLYEEDETAWLEQMAELVAQRRCDELDLDHLSEFLNDMARRDRREVMSRLRVLLMHLLKWEYQPERRSNSWRGSIFSQRRDLIQLLESGTLRKHAAEVFAEAYRDAVELAAVETEMAEELFPFEPPWSLDDALKQPLSS
jgi:hypothetical protein